MRLTLLTKSLVQWNRISGHMHRVSSRRDAELTTMELSDIECKTSADGRGERERERDLCIVDLLQAKQRKRENRRRDFAKSNRMIALWPLRGFINKCDCTHGNGNDFIQVSASLLDESY